MSQVIHFRDIREHSGREPVPLRVERRTQTAVQWPHYERRRRHVLRINGLVVLVGIMIVTISGIAMWREAAQMREPTVGNLLWHFAAAPNCDAARAVGLDSARRGEPGYWQSHDRDRDGVACEPFNENPVFFQRP